MDHHLRNPAGRLFLFLSETMTVGADNAAVRPVWAHYVSVSSTGSTTPELMEALGKVAALPRETADAIATVPGSLPTDYLFRPLEPARNVLAYIGALDTPMAVIRALFTHGTLSELEVISHLLNGSTPLTADPEDRISEMYRLAEEIIKSLGDDNSIDPGVKRILLGHITRFVTAINLLKVVGVDGVLDEWDTLVGRLHREPTILSETRKSSTVIGKIVQLGALVGALTAIVHAPLAIAADVDNYRDLFAPLSIEQVAGPDAGEPIPPTEMQGDPENETEHPDEP